MSNGEWFYAQNGQQAGPVALDALCTMLVQSAMQPTDLVWTNGMTDWQPANTVPQLARAAAGFQEPKAPPPSAPEFVRAPLPQPAAPEPQIPGPQAAEAPQNPALQQATQAPQYHAPLNPLNYVTQYGGPMFAGFWLRFVAIIVDGIIVAIIAGILVVGADFLTHTETTSTGFRGMQLAIGWLYFALMESSDTQATLGKMMLGLRVTDMNGQRITFGRATGRYFGKLVSDLTLGIGYMMAGFTSHKQALHDMMAGCLVVRGPAR